MDTGVLRIGRVAVVGLETTGGFPPLIVQAVVYHVDGGMITGGPFSYWVAPDAPLGLVRASAWPSVRLAPRWAEVAGRVVELVGGRILAVRDRSRLRVLRSHLPNWHPAGIIIAAELARQTWPDSPESSTGPDQGIRVSVAGGGAVAEAHTLALLLGRLLDEYVAAGRARRR